MKIEARGCLTIGNKRHYLYNYTTQGVGLLHCNVCFAPPMSIMDSWWMFGDMQQPHHHLSLLLSLCQTTLLVVPYMSRWYPLVPSRSRWYPLVAPSRIMRVPLVVPIRIRWYPSAVPNRSRWYPQVVPRMSRWYPLVVPSVGVPEACQTCQTYYGRWSKVSVTIQRLGKRCGKDLQQISGCLTERTHVRSLDIACIGDI